MGKKRVYWLEKDLLSSQDLLRGIVESATDAIIAIDETHRIILYNLAAEEIFGYQVEEALGKDLALLLPPEVADKHRHYVEEFLKTGKSPVLGKVVEGKARRKDGTIFPVQISRSATRINRHWVFTAIVRDISAQKEMEKRLLESEKMAAAGMAVSRIVHEIKNPLVAIGGLVLSLYKKENDPEKKKKLSLILKEVERLEKLLLDVSNFAKPLKLEKKRLDLVTLCQEALEVYRPRLEEEGIQIKCVAPQERVEVLVDETRFKEVLFNLFQNALEAMAGRGGELTVEIRPQGDKVIISVRDTGPGIPEEVLKQLFTPFFTTKRRGTGLGLSISLKIVKAHGGHLYARNHPDGAEFVIELPRAQN